MRERRIAGPLPRKEPVMITIIAGAALFALATATLAGCIGAAAL